MRSDGDAYFDKSPRINPALFDLSNSSLPSNIHIDAVRLDGAVFYLIEDIKSNTSHMLIDISSAFGKHNSIGYALHGLPADLTEHIKKLSKEHLAVKNNKIGNEIRASDFAMLIYKTVESYNNKHSTEYQFTSSRLHKDHTTEPLSFNSFIQSEFVSNFYDYCLGNTLFIHKIASIGEDGARKVMQLDVNTYASENKITRQAQYFMDNVSFGLPFSNITVYSDEANFHRTSFKAIEIFSLYGILCANAYLNLKYNEQVLLLDVDAQELNTTDFRMVLKRQRGRNNQSILNKTNSAYPQSHSRISISKTREKTLNHYHRQADKLYSEKKLASGAIVREYNKGNCLFEIAVSEQESFKLSINYKKGLRGFLQRILCGKKIRHTLSELITSDSGDDHLKACQILLSKGFDFVSHQENLCSASTRKIKKHLASNQIENLSITEASNMPGKALNMFSDNEKTDIFYATLEGKDWLKIERPLPPSHNPKFYFKNLYLSINSSDGELYFENAYERMVYKLPVSHETERYILNKIESFSISPFLMFEELLHEAEILHFGDGTYRESDFHALEVETLGENRHGTNKQKAPVQSDYALAVNHIFSLYNQPNAFYKIDISNPETVLLNNKYIRNSHGNRVPAYTVVALNESKNLQLSFQVTSSGITMVELRNIKLPIFVYSAEFEFDSVVSSTNFFLNCIDQLRYSAPQDLNQSEIYKFLVSNCKRSNPS